MLLMIDNYDSFTYNLVQYFGELGADVRVFRNDEITVEQIADLAPAQIVVSPGPCSPAEAGICIEAIRHFMGKLPILVDIVFRRLFSEPRLLASLLNGLTNAAPFSEFLHFKAHANCVGKTDQDRIRQYTAEHPTLAKFCMISDLIFRVFVVVATLAAVAAVITGIILKTVYT